MVVVVDVVMPVGNGLIQRTVFKPHAVTVPAFKDRRIAGGHQSRVGACRAVISTCSRHEVPVSLSGKHFVR